MTASSWTTPLSEMEKQKRARFALLAMVGRLKKEASAYREAEEVYSGIATDLLVDFVGLTLLLQRLDQRLPALKPASAYYTSRLHRSLKQLLRFSPQATDSQERLLNLLSSDGLETMLDVSEEGWLSLSTDQILGNVVRAIEASKEQPQKQSSNSTATTP